VECSLEVLHSLQCAPYRSLLRKGKLQYRRESTQNDSLLQSKYYHLVTIRTIVTELLKWGRKQFCWGVTN
jgi:hypothetical protein